VTARPASQLALALDLTGQLVAGVREDQWSRPTVCDEWTVRDLVTHMALGNSMFAAILRGTPLPEARAAAAPAPAAAEEASRFRAGAAELVSAFGRPGVLEQMFTIPAGPMPGIGLMHIRLVEMLVHGWDLALATGQDTAFPEGLAEQELAFSQEKLTDLPPGRSPFAPPQAVPGDAPAIVRLVALLGRPVSG
jgi:uncharacterized protein (TIGR03086 family)